MTNEEHLIEANELLREELDDARAEVDRMERRPLTSVRVAYIALLVMTVVGAGWSVVVERAAWPVVWAMLTVGWIADRLRREDDPDGKRWTARLWREWYAANHAPPPDKDEDEDDEETEAEATRVRVDSDGAVDDSSEERPVESARAAKR